MRARAAWCPQGDSAQESVRLPAESRFGIRRGNGGLAGDTPGESHSPWWAMTHKQAQRITEASADPGRRCPWCGADVPHGASHRPTGPGAGIRCTSCQLTVQVIADFKTSVRASDALISRFPSD